MRAGEAVSGSGGRGVQRLPAIGQQFVDPADGVIGQAGEHVAVVGEWVDAVAFARADDAEVNRGGAAAGVAAGKKPVVGADLDRANVALAGAVVDRQFAIVAIAMERPPVRQRIMDRLADRILGQHLLALPLQSRDPSRRPPP